MHKLGMPLTPPKWFYLNPIGLPIVYDIAEQIALIAYPDYYAAEHNRFYRLFIKSIWLNIKEKDVTEKEPEKILEVFAGNTEYYFDTDLLDQAIRQAFAVFNDHQGSSFRMAIRNREIFRSPQVIVDYINRGMEVISAALITTAEENFTPILVKPEELEKFTLYVKQTSWAGLSKPARKLVESAIKRIEHDQKNADEQVKSIEEVAAMLESEVDLGPQLKELCEDKSVMKYAQEYFSQRRNGVWLHKIVPSSFECCARSYLGGIPSLKSHADWPYDRQGRRAFFVGQLDCAEINKLVPGYLPDTGILSIFTDHDMEDGWDENHTRKCYIVHVDGENDCINSVPDDYPKPGNWFGPVLDKGPFRAPLERQTVEPMIWPKVELKAHKFATFVSQSHFFDTQIPDRFRTPESRVLYEAISERLEQIEKRYLSKKTTAIFGNKRKKREPLKLFPKTVPGYFHEHLERPFTTYETGFPWSRLHISATILDIMSETREEIRSLIQGDLSAVKDISELVRRFRKQYSWGYGGIKGQPDYLLDNDDLKALDEAVKTQHPDLYNGFHYWLELEHLYRQAAVIYEEVVSEPYAEPTTEEKASFIEWVAGWINHGCALGDARLGQILEQNDYPRTPTTYRLPRIGILNKFTYSRFFGDRLKWACLSALHDATALCMGNSAEAAARIPPSAFEHLQPSNHSISDFHRSLGYGTCVQHAAYKFKDKVLLLEVQDDRYLFSNFGGGALQFWISSEDLKAMRFDKAFMTVECT